MMSHQKKNDHKKHKTWIISTATRNGPATKKKREETKDQEQVVHKIFDDPE